MRRAAKRDTNEAEVVKALRQFGVSVYLLDQPCDLLLGYRGRTYLAEVKNGTKGYGAKLNDNQAKFAQEWRGSELTIIRNLDDVEQWVKERK